MGSHHFKPIAYAMRAKDGEYAQGKHWMTTSILAGFVRLMQFQFAQVSLERSLGNFHELEDSGLLEVEVQI